MTLMLASVTGPDEAETAIAAGADIIDFAGSGTVLGTPDLATLAAVVRAVAGRRRVSAGVGELPADLNAAVARVQAVAEAGADSLLVPVLDESFRALSGLAGRVRLIGVLLADRDADLGMIGQLADAGFAGSFLDTAEPGNRLLDHADPPKLAQFMSLCRNRDLAGGFAGGLEAPDVPRLLALKPDVLGFRDALCAGHDRRAGIEAGQAAAIRRLIPVHGAPAADAVHGVAREVDRVFVRDFVLQMSIGAYRHERGRPQRVRFEVMAEVPRHSGSRDHIGEVFSYDLILDTIRSLAENRHVNLVETLAEEIAARLLEHGGIAAVTVKVEKLDVAPAIVGVEITRRATGGHYH